MATSKRAKRSATIVAIAIALLGVAAVPLVVAAGGSGGRAGPRAAEFRSEGAFSLLRPGPPPAGWQQTTTATSRATLFYPPGWKRIPGDVGTVTSALKGEHGLYVGYLNATPRQGAEQLHGWAAFRIDHNREEGDKRVREVAAAEGLRFTNARGSCVVDDYLSKIGSNPYREIACLVSGPSRADVLIAAGRKQNWPALSGTLERAVSAFIQR